MTDMSGEQRDARRAEIEAEFAAFDAEVSRAVEQARVEGGIAELTGIRLDLAAARVEARSTVRRHALTVGIDRIDARLRVLRELTKGLA